MGKETLMNGLKKFGSAFKKIITNKFFIIFVICFIFLVIWKSVAAIRQMQEQSAKYMQPALVEITEIKTQDIKKSFEFSGRIEAQ